MVTEQSTGTDESVRITGRHRVGREGYASSMHACLVLYRETGRVHFGGLATSPRHAVAPEWPAFDGDLIPEAVAR